MVRSSTIPLSIALLIFTACGRSTGEPTARRLSVDAPSVPGEVERVTAEDYRVVFEFRDHGSLRGRPYRNVVAISLDVCGEKICGYREYFGLVGPPPEAEGDE